MRAPNPGKSQSIMSWLIGIVAVIAIIFILTRVFEKDGNDENTYSSPTPTSAPASTDAELPIYAMHLTDAANMEVAVI